MNPASLGSAAHSLDLPAPSLARRLACALYEAVLLFGIVFGVALAYGVATQQRNAIVGRSGLNVALFTVIGIYFVWCWTRHGQTLPMQTWHIRLVDARGERVAPWRAMLRYLFSWLWFVPGLAIAHFAAVASSAGIGVVVFGWAIAYAALSYLQPQRQFVHDAICGTRLITHRPSRA